MGYLLDTNVLIYILSAPTELSSDAKRIVQNEERLFVSIASLWEIGIKQGLGKLRIVLTIPEIEVQCALRDIQMLPIRSTTIEKLKELPEIHRDPFDRLLIAQALDAGFALVTRDKIIPQYPLQTIW